MAKLRFIKSWGSNKVGVIKEFESKTTIHWLVDVYKFAVIEPIVPVLPKVISEPERDLYKYVRKPQRDKMVYGAPKAKKKEEMLDEI